MTLYIVIHPRNQLLLAYDFSTKIVGIYDQRLSNRYLYIDDYDFWDSVGFKEIFGRILLMMMSFYIT